MKMAPPLSFAVLLAKVTFVLASMYKVVVCKSMAPPLTAVLFTNEMVPDSTMGQK